MSTWPSRSNSWGLGFWVCALGVFIAGFCAVASAQERLRVLVLEPAAPTRLERELLTRLKGELGAAGIDVVAAPLDDGRDPELAVRSEQSVPDVQAAFATREVPPPDPASKAPPILRLWLSDRVTGTVLVEEGRELDATLVASSLAVQGFELLQARVADWRWRASAPAPTPAPPHPPPPPPLPAPPPEPPSELMATLGMGLSYDPPSGKAALTPLARIMYMPGPLHSALGAADLGVRLSVAGVGTALVLEERDRRVDVDQSFALIEGVLRLDSSTWLSPHVAIGAGAYRVGVEGADGPGVLGRSEHTLSALAGAGAGLGVRPLQYWLLHLEAQGLFAIQPTAVQIGTTRATTLGRPLLVFSIGMGIAL